MHIPTYHSLHRPGIASVPDAVWRRRVGGWVGGIRLRGCARRVGRLSADWVGGSTTATTVFAIIEIGERTGGFDTTLRKLGWVMMPHSPPWVHEGKPGTCTCLYLYAPAPACTCTCTPAPLHLHLLPLIFVYL